MIGAEAQAACECELLLSRPDSKDLPTTQLLMAHQSSSYLRFELEIDRWSLSINVCQKRDKSLDINIRAVDTIGYVNKSTQYARDQEAPE
jgi:hypothetical protein